MITIKVSSKITMRRYILLELICSGGRTASDLAHKCFKSRFIPDSNPQRITSTLRSLESYGFIGRINGKFWEVLV
jgi:hypothetical protein